MCVLSNCPKKGLKWALSCLTWAFLDPWWVVSELKMDPGVGPVTTHLFFLSLLIRAALKNVGQIRSLGRGGGNLGPIKLPHQPNSSYVPA